MAVDNALLTYEDLERFPEDKTRREIIGGRLFVPPAPELNHERVVWQIGLAFHAHADAHSGEAFAGKVDARLGIHDVVEPDILYIAYIAPERLGIEERRFLMGAPTIVVEVLSPSNKRYDRVKKRHLYARYGIAEYWIVDIDARSVERLTQPAGDDYQRSETFTGLVPSVAAPGLEADLRRVFARLPKTAEE